MRFTVVVVGRILQWYNSQSYAYHIIVQVEYMYVACCCCAAAADVDLASSAYPLALLSLLRPRLIRSYLHMSPIADIRGAAAEYYYKIKKTSAVRSRISCIGMYTKCCCCGWCCSVCCCIAAVAADAC